MFGFVCCCNAVRNILFMRMSSVHGVLRAVLICAFLSTKSTFLRGMAL